MTDTQMRRSPTRTELQLVTGEEFKNDLSPASIVETLIFVASVILMSGASKAGKTWAAFQLAMCVASGEPFLGLDVTRAPVLLISLELSVGMVRERMRRIAESTGVPMPTIGENFFLAAPTSERTEALNLALEHDRRLLVAAIRQTSARLVVIDTLYRFLPGLDPSSNAEMGEVFGQLNAIAQESGAALLLLDHVAKGDQLGPISHSAIGAVVKGGAARTVINLKRTSREDGGRWALDVESHFGSWDTPLYYERPRLPDGSRGDGCVRCGSAAGFALSLDRVHDLFDKHGERNADGRLFFRSKNALTQGLIAAGIATGNADSEEIIRALQRDFCSPSGSRHGLGRPITTSEGPRRAVIFTWRPDSEWSPTGAAT